MIIEQIDLITGDAEGATAPAGLGGIVVQIQTSSGQDGLGEAVTDEAHRSTSHASVLAWLQTYGASVRGATCANINELNRLLDAADAGAGCPAARAAIEMAAFDVASKARGRPLHEALGGGYREQFDLTCDIDVGDADLLALAKAAVAQGYAGIRLTMRSPKIGAADIRAVLEACGPAISVDVACHQLLGTEANASMLLESVHADGFFRNLALIQPLDSLDLQGHGRLREKHASPIGLEETISTPAAMARVVRHAAADRIVLDLWRVGGLQNAKRIASICEAAAIGVIVSGNCRSAVGRAAIGHLAASIHGSHPISTLPWDDVEEGLHGGLVFTGGRAHLAGGPGLGVSLDRTRLAGRRIEPVNIQLEPSAA